MKELLINNKETFISIYLKYVDDVFRFVMSKTYNRETSEEIVSDTFYIFLDQFDSINLNKGNIKTYLFGIALNKLRQKWSKDKVNKFISLDEDFHVSLEDSKSKKRESLFKKVILELEKLPLKYKNVIKKRFLEYKSIKEVAIELNISNSNVTTIQNRGLRILKEKLND